MLAERLQPESGVVTRIMGFLNILSIFEQEVPKLKQSFFYLSTVVLLLSLTSFKKRILLVGGLYVVNLNHDSS